MRYDAVVFDNDGVLTTPTDHAALERAMQTAFDNVGVTNPTSDHVDSLINPTVDDLQTVASEHGVDAETLWKARERAAIDVQQVEIRDGRKTLYDDVQSLDSLTTPKAIVSNNQHETIENIIDHFGLEGFDPWYGREPTVSGIERKKPTPYYLEKAIDELAVDNPLYVGDSRVDIAAANACGIDCAFIWRPHRNGYELPETPTHELESLSELASLV